MGEWQEIPLGNVCSQVLTGGTPLTKISAYYINGKIPWLKTKEVNFCGIRNTENFISEQGLANSSAKLVPSNSVIVAMYGQGDTAGRVAINKIPVATNQACCNLIIDNGVADYQFIYYLLKNSYFELVQRKTGSAQPNLNTKLIKDFEITLPGLPEQKAIASVLSSLDDKIDLLHRQNKTLEAMAETLFRQWFVPARAGEPHADGEEAQEDWEEDSILEVIQLVGGGTPKTSIAEYWDGGIPWLAGGDIASNHKSFINYSVKNITESGLNNSSAKLLPKYATVISARGTVGKYCLLSRSMAFSQSNYGVMPNVSECFFFTYLLVNHVVEELQSSAYGSVFDTITTTTFKEIKIPLPTETEIIQFEQSASPYFKKMF